MFSAHSINCLSNLHHYFVPAFFFLYSINLPVIRRRVLQELHGPPSSRKTTAYHRPNFLSLPLRQTKKQSTPNLLDLGALSVSVHFLDKFTLCCLFGNVFTRYFSTLQEVSQASLMVVPWLSMEHMKT